jgi:hypothetical protein
LRSELSAPQRKDTLIGAIAGRYLLDPSAPAADVYFGRCQTILPERERIKRDNIKQRRLRHHSKAA